MSAHELQAQLPPVCKALRPRLGLAYFFGFFPARRTHENLEQTVHVIPPDHAGQLFVIIAGAHQQPQYGFRVRHSHSGQPAPDLAGGPPSGSRISPVEQRHERHRSRRAQTVPRPGEAVKQSRSGPGGTIRDQLRVRRSRTRSVGIRVEQSPGGAAEAIEIKRPLPSLPGLGP
jgi:hypothetical protein